MPTRACTSVAPCLARCHVPECARRRPSNGFDAARVTRNVQWLRRSEFPLDPERLAERLMDSGVLHAGAMS